jgi:membrane associated rhomboid family serine protease
MQDLKRKEKFSWYVIKLSLIILAVFALQNVFPFYTDNFALSSSTFLQQPWSLVTYIFLHADINHIFSNLFSLVLFGFILEKTVGSRNFLIIFFSSGIFAGIVGLLFYPSVIGASGAIFGIMGVLVVIRPKMVVLAFGIPIPMLVAVAMWAALDLGGVFYPSSIANIGHLAGLCAGIFIGFWIRPRYKVAEKKKEKIKIDEEYFRRWEEKYMKH